MEHDWARTPRGAYGLSWAEYVGGHGGEGEGGGCLDGEVSSCIS